MIWWNIYLVVFLFSAFLSLVLTPVFKKVAIWTNTVDKPATQNHKNHKKATPLMGGLAMCISWLITITIGIYAPFFLKIQNLPQVIIDNLSGVFQVENRLVAIMIGAILITVLGFIDDRSGMSAKLKLIGQIVITAFVVIYGELTISLFINIPFINELLAIIWIVTIINAINFFDNMDGLAVGISSIAFLFFTLTSMIFSHYFVACIGAAGFGVTLGFWFYNHTPASIFMGDSGSHFLGYILGIMGTLTTFYQEGFTVTPLSVLVPIFILGIPLFDLISVVIIRMKAGEPIYIGDNNHISHRFNKMGMSRKNAVFSVHLLSIIISLSVLPMLWGGRLTVTVCLLQACIILLLISILQYHTRNTNKD